MRRFKLAIIGAGPGGLSAAARAAKHGLPYILLEASAQIANTIHHFQKGKWVMAEPSHLPIHSDMSFTAAVREDILARWSDEARQLDLNIQFNTEAISIEHIEGEFKLKLSSGETLQAEKVILAMGVQGNPRKLNVSGDDLPGVQYQLRDPDEYRDETIVVVGAGDAGVENALALATSNRVHLLNRSEEFTQCNPANLALLEQAIAKRKIIPHIRTTADRIDATPLMDQPLAFHINTANGEDIIHCHRVIARLGTLPPRPQLERFGIRFLSTEADALPNLQEDYQSDVPGLFVIGALAGFPLIKQAMNQGVEVIEWILGNKFEPADEALLQSKVAQISPELRVADGIRLIREKHPLLGSLNRLQLREFIAESDILNPAVGNILFHQFDASSSLYCILQGTVEIRIASPQEADKVITLNTGEFFGEIGLLSGRHRSGTASAGEDCILVETPRSAMLKLINNNKAVEKRIDEVALSRIILSTLGGDLSNDEINTLIQDAEELVFKAGTEIFHEGDEADGLYMIKRGSVTISRLQDGKEQVLAYVAAGNYLGEMALLSDQPRSATVRAATFTEAVLLRADKVRAILQNNSKMRQVVNQSHIQRIHSDEMNQLTESSEMIHFLVKQGIGEATDALLIDYDRCIRCDNCEYACAQVHNGTSLLKRSGGVTFRNIHVPISCRHCENPQCMKDCPPDAIRRSSSGEVYISEDCIGCSNCVRFCPYGVITLIAPQQQLKPTGFWQVLFGQSDQQPAASDAAKVAVKCDMCGNLSGGPACVRACPTGAAIRINPEKLMEILS